MRKAIPQETEIDRDARQKAGELVYRDSIAYEELIMRMRHIEARGIYDERGNAIKPYANADFSIVTVTPPEEGSVAESPQLIVDDRLERLWTPQPTIYEDQLYIMKVLDHFLTNLEVDPLAEETSSGQIGLCGLSRAVGYEWPGRGGYHVMPPVVEHHTYQLDRGKIDLDHLRESYEGCYVKDAKGVLHPLSAKNLYDFYIDHQSFNEHMPIFNPTVRLLDYGRQRSGEWSFPVICDGSHRIAYAIEENGQPIQALLVQPRPGEVLIPYYAVPRPFHPATRLTSKKAERIFNRLENDKIHLLHEIIKKAGHYNWELSGLKVSSLRTQERD